MAIISIVSIKTAPDSVLRILKPDMVSRIAGRKRFDARERLKRLLVLLFERPMIEAQLDVIPCGLFHSPNRVICRSEFLSRLGKVAGLTGLRSGRDEFLGGGADPGCDRSAGSATRSRAFVGTAPRPGANRSGAAD